MQETQEMLVLSLGQEEGKATHSSILAWRIPWTEKPDRLHSKGSQSWTRLKQLSIHALICIVKYVFQAVSFLQGAYNSGWER